MYILVNPTSTEKSEGTPENVDWEFAQKEIAQAKGFATGFGSGLSKGNDISILVFNMKIFHLWEGAVAWKTAKVFMSMLPPYSDHVTIICEVTIVQFATPSCLQGIMYRQNNNMVTSLTKELLFNKL